MGRYDSIDKTELSFFDALNDGEVKVAVDLPSGAADALGIPTVSPAILDELEAQAQAQAPQEQAHQEGQAEQAEPPMEGGEEGAVQGQPQSEPEETEPVEVEQFQRSDEVPTEEPRPEPELPSRATHGKLFTDKRAHPLQLLEVLTMRYGTKWTEWESETLWWSLRKSFGPVGEVVRNKIMALRIAVTRDITWLDWDVFEDSGLAWNDIVPTIGAFQPMTPMQVAFAIQVLRGIRPDDEFAHEVRAYMAAILDDHGWIWAPGEWFDGAQEILDRGRDHLVGLKEDVASTWERVQEMNPEDVEWDEDNPLDIHILKLFVVKRYLEEREALKGATPGASLSSSMVSPPVP